MFRRGKTEQKLPGGGAHGLGFEGRREEIPG